MIEERKTIDLYNETFEAGSDVAYFLMVKTLVGVTSTFCGGLIGLGIASLRLLWYSFSCRRAGVSIWQSKGSNPG